MYERNSLAADITAALNNATEAALRNVARKIRGELDNPPIGATRKVSYELAMRRALKIVEDTLYADWKRDD